MKFVFNKLVGKLMDAGFALYLILNDNYSEIVKRYNLKADPDIEKAIKHIKSKLKTDYNFMELFFRDESSNEEIASIGPPFLDFEFILNFSNIKSYLDFLINIDESTIKEEFIKSLLWLKRDNDFDKVKVFLQDEDKLIEYIDNLNISSDLKWRALRFIRNPIEDMKEYVSVLTEYFNICETPAVKKFDKKFDNFCDFIGEMNDDEKIDFLKKYLNKLWQDDIIKEKIYLTILFFNFSCVLIDKKDSTTQIALGYKFKEVIDEMAGQSEIEKKLNILKNMSDNTRFKILMLLKNEELFGQQIAEKIGITMATVSYHMNFLFAGDMVEVSERGHRIYYRLKKQTFKEIGEFIQKIFIE